MGQERIKGWAKFRASPGRTVQGIFRPDGREYKLPQYLMNISVTNLEWGLLTFNTTQHPSKQLTSGIFPSKTSLSIDVTAVSAKFNIPCSSVPRGSHAVFTLENNDTALHYITNQMSL